MPTTADNIETSEERKLNRECDVCGGTPTRHFVLLIDGVALELQPYLCAQHGDAYILRCGYSLGSILKDGEA